MHNGRQKETGMNVSGFTFIHSFIYSDVEYTRPFKHTHTHSNTDRFD